MTLSLQVCLEMLNPFPGVLCSVTLLRLHYYITFSMEGKRNALSFCRKETLDRQWITLAFSWPLLSCSCFSRDCSPWMPRLACLTAIHAVTCHVTASTALPTQYIPNSLYFLRWRKKKDQLDFNQRLSFKWNISPHSAECDGPFLELTNAILEMFRFLHPAVKFMDFYANFKK